MAVAHGVRAERRGIRRSNFLTKTGHGLIAAPMINATTILTVRRRRIIAVWADVSV
jgi:hypothetical protein